MLNAPAATHDAIPKGLVASLSELLAEEHAHRPGVATHATSVARHARALAAEVGVSGDELNLLALAVRHHDVGKLRTPHRILNKNGRLTEEEAVLMARHAADGALMLAEVPGVPQVMLDVARYHHEKYDGLGYEGLAGEDIPFAARVAQVADVYDALSAPRAYKPGMPEHKVLGIMTARDRSERTTRYEFDPVLLRRFVDLRLRAPGIDMPAEDRAALRAFADSDPNEDLSPAMRELVEFDPDGSRTLFGTVDGERVAVAHVTPDGRRGEPEAPAAGPAFG